MYADLRIASTLYLRVANLRTSELGRGLRSTPGPGSHRSLRRELITLW